jgi:Amt family ammonium transporter
MEPVSSGLDPTTPLEAFNNLTDANGGDSRLYNLNVFYNVSRPTWHCSDGARLTFFRQAGDIAWMLTSTALVLLMIPGVG